MTIHPTTPQVQAAIVTAMNAMGQALIGTTWQPILECPVPREDIDAMLQDLLPYQAPTCSVCSRERDSYRPMDAYDYNPLQVAAGLPCGWYHDETCDICPECMTKTFGGPAWPDIQVGSPTPFTRPEDAS